MESPPPPQLMKLVKGVENGGPGEAAGGVAPSGAATASALVNCGDDFGSC